MNYQAEVDDMKQVNCFPWSQLEYRHLPGSWVTLILHTLCAHTPEKTHCWSWILSSYHCAGVQSGFIAALTLSTLQLLLFLFVLSGFFKTTRPKLSLLPVFVLHLGWRWNTWIAQPRSTGDTLPPPAQRWTGLGPTMLLWLKMGGVGFHPAMCLVCFSTLAVGTQLFRDLACFW